jgi:hypothetical protein
VTPAPNTEVDHLVVAADTVADGVAWCEATLGVTPGAGGRHAFMGTHNRLLNLSGGGYPRCYLEIIAIDPDAPAPARPRWFGLDTRAPGPPTLWHVVARTAALVPTREALRGLGLDPGEPLAASRPSPQGLLRWQITVPADGALRCSGALPTLIQWDGTHPADHLPPCGVSLRALTLRGVDPAAGAVLGLAGTSFPATAGPALSAVLAGPAGEVALHSSWHALAGPKGLA